MVVFSALTTNAVLTSVQAEEAFGMCVCVYVCESVHFPVCCGLVLNDGGSPVN